MLFGTPKLFVFSIGVFGKSKKSQPLSEVEGSWATIVPPFGLLRRDGGAPFLRRVSLRSTGHCFELGRGMTSSSSPASSPRWWWYMYSRNLTLVKRAIHSPQEAGVSLARRVETGKSQLSVARPSGRELRLG